MYCTTPPALKKREEEGSGNKLKKAKRSNDKEVVVRNGVPCPKKGPRTRPFRLF